MNGASVTTSDVINLTIGRITNEELEAAVAVWFKDEDEVPLGTSVGPVWIQVGGSTPDNTNPMPSDGKLVPFQKDVTEWFPVSMADELAKALGIPLVRS